MLVKNKYLLEEHEREEEEEDKQELSTLLKQ